MFKRTKKTRYILIIRQMCKEGPKRQKKRKKALWCPNTFANDVKVNERALLRAESML